MKHTSKIVAMFFALFLTMVGAAFASPITIEDMRVQDANGDFLVLLSLENQNVSVGVLTQLEFTIEELGQTHTENVIVDSNNTETFQFNLEEVVQNFNQLRKGETYRIVVENEVDSVSDVFVFGSVEVEDDNGLDLTFDEVEVNSVEVTDLDTLQVLNGESLDVLIKFTAQSDFDDARIRASIDGYEHGTIDASTEIFSVEAGKTYVKRLSLFLPADMDTQQDYRLRIFGANDLSGLTQKDLTLFIDTQRHRVDILDLVMTPSSGVEPGQNIIANVRMKNRGQQEQDSVKVSVEIPQLGIAESSFVSNLGTQDAITSDDMLLFVPSSAKAGSYPVKVVLAYNDGFTESVTTFSLNVLAPDVVPEQNLLVSFNDNIDLWAGKTKSFDIVVANPNAVSKPISISSLDNTWAEVEVSPSLKMIQGGDSASFTVTVTPKDAIEGQQTLTLFVKEGSETVSELTVNTYVEGYDGINWVNVVLIILLIIAIIVLIALVAAIARKKNGGHDDYSEEKVSSNEEYY